MIFILTEHLFYQKENEVEGLANLCGDLDNVCRSLDDVCGSPAQVCGGLGEVFYCEVYKDLTKVMKTIQWER